MNRMFCAMLGVFSLISLASCSSYHHHGMMGAGKGDAYWHKGQREMAALIDRTVKDPDKAKQVNAIVVDIINELRAGHEQERAYHRQIYTLNASYMATRIDFTKIIDEAHDQRRQTSARILALRFKMKDSMTADEWKALGDQMLSYSGRYQHGSVGEKAGY